MAINSQSLSTIQNKVTGLTTNETDFRSGVNDTLVQVDATEIKLSGCDASDLVKLNEVTATAAELNTLDGISASTSELNILNGATLTTGELNLLDGVTATTAEINKLDGLITTTAELNQINGSGISKTDLQKLSAVTSSAAELNVLDGFLGNTADLNRTVQLDAMGNGVSGQVMTSDGDGTYSWTTPSSFTWVLEDGDGTEVSISTQQVKFIEGAGIDIDWTDTAVGNAANPFDLTFTNIDRGSSQNIFKNIQINGTTSFNADSNTANLNFKTGTNILLVGNDGDNSVSFSTVASPSFTNVTALATVSATNVTASGTVTAADVNSTSDIRLKENIEPITEALELINRLNGVYFNKIVTPEKKEIGFIAQEVEEVLPEVVGEAGEYKAVSYSRIVAVLVESVKELTKRVEELEANSSGTFKS